MKPYIVHDEVSRSRAAGLIAALNIARRWQVTVEPEKRRRTLGQNALMWKWLHEVARHVSDHTGMDPDDIHEFFKAKFLQPRVVEIGGEVVEHYTTRRLSTQEMSAYIDAIYRFVTSELGIILPVPEEAHRR